MPCAKIGATLIKQIEAFSPANGCDKCHYEVKAFLMSALFLNSILFISLNQTCFLFQLVSTLPVLINANHTSPDGLQAENITFVLSPGTMGSGCHVSVRNSSLLVRLKTALLSYDSFLRHYLE